MEDIIRQAIKEFDYPECTIFKQLVQTIAPVEKVSDLELVVFFLQKWTGKKGVMAYRVWLCFGSTGLIDTMSTVKKRRIK